MARGEWAQVSNGHIGATQKQIRRVSEQVQGWEAAERVFAICSSNAQLAKKVRRPGRIGAESRAAQRLFGSYK